MAKRCPSVTIAFLQTVVNNEKKKKRKRCAADETLRTHQIFPRLRPAFFGDANVDSAPRGCGVLASQHCFLVRGILCEGYSWVR